VGSRPASGLRLWDVRFGGERIVYELALQEALVSASGATPSQARSPSAGASGRSSITGFSGRLYCACARESRTSLNLATSPACAMISGRAPACSASARGAARRADARVGFEKARDAGRGGGAQSLAQQYLSAAGLGAGMHELVAGVDCPHEAAFLDTAALFDSAGAITRPRSLCVFELATGAPLRRHYAQARPACVRRARSLTAPMHAMALVGDARIVLP
jgi:hypothetical protein